MQRPTRHPCSIALSLTAALLLLGLCATALGALPIGGKSYTGSTTLPPIKGHRGPVSFTVSSNGRTLTAFKYGTVGCTPVSTFSGNPYTSAANIIKVGTIATSAGGSFAATNVRSTYLDSRTGKKYLTLSAVAGTFQTTRSATGTITFSQTISGPRGTSSSCGPYTIRFTAATR